MLSFGSAVGNLFNRLGKLGLLIKETDPYTAAQLINTTDTVLGVVAQYNAESDIQAIMGNGYISLLNSIGSSVGSIAQNMAGTTISRMVFRDIPQTPFTPIAEVIRQMKAAGASVLAMTITAVPSASFTGTGVGIINVSTRRPSDGVVLENSFAETMQVTCSADSYTGNATIGNESFLITGETGQSNPFAFDWPIGSSARINLNAIDGNVDVGSGNLLTNSGFEDFTSNVPDNWTVVVGAGGTNIFDENTIVYDPVLNGSAIRLTGDAPLTLTQIRQLFDNSTGTSGELDPLTQYSFNMFLRRDGVAAAAGVLTVDLADVNGVVINDENGTPNSFTIDLTALTTVYTGYTGTFRTPRILPSAQYIRIRLSTALTDARSVYLDKASLGLFSQCYAGGPFAAVHSGNVPFVIRDFGTIVVTNSRGAAGTLSTFQTLLFRFFGNGEILLSSSSVPTISDGLIG